MLFWGVVEGGWRGGGWRVAGGGGLAAGERPTARACRRRLGPCRPPPARARARVPPRGPAAALARAPRCGFGRGGPEKKGGQQPPRASLGQALGGPPGFDAARARAGAGGRGDGGAGRPRPFLPPGASRRPSKGKARARSGQRLQGLRVLGRPMRVVVAKGGRGTREEATAGGGAFFSTPPLSLSLSASLPLAQNKKPSHLRPRAASHSHKASLARKQQQSSNQAPEPLTQRARPARKAPHRLSFFPFSEGLKSALPPLSLPPRARHRPPRVPAHPRAPGVDSPPCLPAARSQRPRAPPRRQQTGLPAEREERHHRGERRGASHRSLSSPARPAPAALPSRGPALPAGARVHGQPRRPAVRPGEPRPSEPIARPRA